MPQVVVPLVAVAISAAIPAAGAVAFGTITYATIAASIIVTGALAGAALALAPRQRQNGTLPQLPRALSMISRASPVANRFYGFGLVSDGGDTIAYEIEEGAHGNRFLGQAIVVDCGPINGVQAIFCDNELLPLTSGAVPVAINTNTGTTYISGIDFGPTIRFPNGGVKWAMRFTYQWQNNTLVQVPIGFAPGVITEFVNGAAPGTPSVLWRAFFGDDPSSLVTPWRGPSAIGWSANHRCDNLSVLYTVASKFNAVDFTANFPEGFPKWRILRRAALAFDPRDEEQDFDDPATWKWSRNPAICRAWHATHPDGLRLAYDEINWDTIAEAADYCDRLVPKFGGGTEPFARCDMQWNTGMERRDVETIIDISCDGFAYQDAQGRLSYRIYQPEDPTVTLTLADISSIVEEHAGGPFSSDTVFVGTYVEPRLNFQNTSAPEVKNSAGVAAIGEYVQTLSHEGVQSFNQSYRLTHRAERRVNPRRRLTIVGSWPLMRARNARVIAIDCPTIGVVGDFWISAPLEFSPRLERWTLQVIELAADAFDDVVPPRDPVNPTISVPIPGETTPPAPGTLTLIKVTIGADDFIQASVPVPTNETLAVYFQISDDAGATWDPMTDVIGQWARQAGPFGAGTYQVRAWFVNIGGTVGPFSAVASITI